MRGPGAARTIGARVRLKENLVSQPTARAPRALRSPFSLCVLALLLVGGVARGGEPDYEAVSDRLLKAVAAGELSPEQAEAMMGKLAKVRFAERVAELKLQKTKRWKKKKGKDAKAMAWIPGYLEKLGLDGKQRKLTLGAIKKVVALAKSQAEYPEAYTWVRGYLEKLDLNPEQIEQVEEVMKKAAAIATGAQGDERDRNWQAEFRKLGVPAGALEKFRVALKEAGVTGEQQETALGAVLKLAHVWRTKPDANHDEFHREVKRYLAGELELTGEQIGLVFGLAKQTFVAGKGKQKGKRAKLRDHYRKLGIDGPVFGKIAASLRESGLEGDQVDQALGGIARLLYGQLKPESSGDELRTGLVKHFKKAGFSGEQIEHMVGLAKQIFPHVKERLEDSARREGKLSQGLLRAYSELGIDEEVLGKVRHRLGDFGLEGKQVEGALGGLLKVLYGMKAKGKGYQLGSRLDLYFRQDLRLNDEQIKQLLNLARRLNGLRR